jgi:hypothetical protein
VLDHAQESVRGYPFVFVKSHEALLASNRALTFGFLDLAQAIYTKMIPMLFSEFEWSFTDPDAEKVLQCTFPVRYVNLMMQWKERTHLNK